MTTSARVPNFRYSYVLRRRGRLSRRPEIKIHGEAATFLIGAPEFRGPPWAAARTAVEGGFSGNSTVRRAAWRGGPYMVD